MNTSFPATPVWVARLKRGDKLRFVDSGNLCTVPPVGSICEFVKESRAGEILVRWDKEVGHHVAEQHLYPWRFELVNPSKHNQTKTMIPKTIAAATAEKALLEKEKTKLEAAILKIQNRLNNVGADLTIVNNVLGL